MYLTQFTLRLSNPYLETNLLQAATQTERKTIERSSTTSSLPCVFPAESIGIGPSALLVLYAEAVVLIV